MIDPLFKGLVDSLYKMIADLEMTPTEVREAAMLATIKYEQEHFRPLHWLSIRSLNDPDFTRK